MTWRFIPPSVVALALAAAGPRGAPEDVHHAVQAIRDLAREPAAAADDPAAAARECFERIASRYRALVSYADRVSFTCSIESDGDQARRTECRLACTLEDGALDVRCTSRSIAESLGLKLPFNLGDTVEHRRARLSAWLAPHMTLAVSDDPLAELWPTAHGRFHAVSAGIVESEGNPAMLRLELRGDDRAETSDPDGRPATTVPPPAAIALYINPRTMLIERIMGGHELPGLGRCQIDLLITPVRAAWPSSDAAVTEEAAAAQPATLVDPPA
jgi:hypothetical protein